LFNGSGSVTFQFGQVTFLCFDWQEIPAKRYLLVMDCPPEVNFGPD